MKAKENGLLRIAERVSDGRAVDWDTEERLHPDLAGTLRWMRHLESVARKYGGLDSAVEETAGIGVEMGDEVGAGVTDRAVRAGAPPLQKWGHLRILERIDGGQFGDVYRAFDPGLQREVALKLWRPKPGQDEGDLDQFLAEARRLARVRHPNVLVVHGADRHEGIAGMWTDLVHGETLEKRLETQGALGETEAALIGIELCGALAAVHAAGLVHRDVKTANVMRAEGGHYVLMDFGTVGELTPAGHLDESITMRGTPLAMAPEQLQFGKITPAADIYELGALLYRLVTGHYPIEAEDLYALAEKHRTGEVVPLRDRRPELDARFIQVIEKALDPDPARRHASAGAMERALLEALRGASAAGGPRADESDRLPAFVVQEQVNFPTTHDDGPSKASTTSGAPMPVKPGRMRWYRRWQVYAGALVVCVAVVVAGNHGRRTAQSAIQSVKQQGPVEGTREPIEETRQPLAPVTPPPTPVVPAFDVNASLNRATASGYERLLPGARVAPGDHLFVEIEGSKPMYVYVLTEDAEGSGQVLYPTGGTQVSPFDAGKTHRIPSGNLYWPLDDVGNRESFAIVASTQRQSRLEEWLKSVRLRGVGEPEPLPARMNEGLALLPPSGADPWVWRITLDKETR